MDLGFSAMGPSGHVQAEFDGEEIRMEFSKTTPGERGLMETLIEKGKAEKMTVHSIDKKGELKLIEDANIIGKIFEKKGEIALKGTKESVSKLAKVYIDKEIEGGRVVMEAQDDNSWHILKIGEFEEKPGRQKVKSVATVGAG